MSKFCRPVTPHADRTAPAAAGFTLIEVLLAVAISSMAMVAVSQAFLGTLNAKAQIEIHNSTNVEGQRILTLLERDLTGLWHHNIKGNQILLGENVDISGYDADRINFYTTKDSVAGALDSTDRLRKPTINEVGYWLRENEEIPGLLELWRREDPLIDDDIRTDGHFELVSSRLKDFQITYYETLGHRAEELYEWDTARRQRLPRRIKIEFTVHRKVGSRNRVSTAEVDDIGSILQKYTRHFVFDPRYVDIIRPGVALMPIAPPRPEAEAGGGGGGLGEGEGGAGEGEGTRSQGAGALVEQEVGQGNRGDRGSRLDGGGEGRRPTQPRLPGANPVRPPGGGARPPNNGQIPIDLGELLRGLGGNNSGNGNPFGGLGGR